MSASWAVRVQRLLPQRLLCRVVYHASRCHWRWFKTILISWFARHYRIDLGDAVTSDLSGYRSLNDFFTRALKTGARSIDRAAGTVISPVDGRLTEFGRIRHGTLLQAKGFSYGVAELLGESAPDTAPFEQGFFATLYLAPHNYHRVHMPFDGRLRRARYIAGRRFSVNAATTGAIERLFCRNERLVAWFDTPFGTSVMVLVGALNVSSISTVPHGEIASGRDRELPECANVEFSKGEEFGRFNLGSTVIVLLPAESTFAMERERGADLRLGMRIGSAPVCA